MEIKILEKCVTATNSFKKGEVANIKGADAEKLVKDGKAEYTTEGAKMLKASKEALEAKAKAKVK